MLAIALLFAFKDRVFLDSGPASYSIFTALSAVNLPDEHRKSFHAFTGNDFVSSLKRDTKELSAEVFDRLEVCVQAIQWERKVCKCSKVSII